MRKFKLKKCTECQKMYIPSYNNQKQCSTECRLSADRRRKRERQREKRGSFSKEHICRCCGASFIALNASMYCSDFCRKKAQLEREKKYRMQKKTRMKEA